MTDLSLAEPLKVAEPVEWDDGADVVVIGSGCAGLCAALEAHEQGASVLLVDRFEGGGATGFSGGVVYAGATPYQAAAGYADTAENMFRYLSQEVGDAVSPDTLRRFCQESAGNLEWLEKHGVRFSAELFEGKTSYPPPGKFLYFSGNERTERNAALAAPAPRGHRTMGEGWTGKDLFQALSASVRKAGLPTMLHSRATRLVMDAAGRAIGVELVSLPSPSRPRHQFIYRSVSPWKPFQAGTVSRAIAAASQLERTDGVQKRIRARKGIVIATGGYAFNQDMLARYNTAYAPHATRFLRLGSLACTGSGIEMAHAAGAKLGKMDRVYAGRSLAPPQAMLDGIVVNSQGHRFINEDACNAFVGEAVANQPDGRAWLILDWQALRAVAHGLLPRDKNFIPYSLPKILNIILGGTRQSAQIRKLAAKCRIDSSSLEKTVTAYNAACLSGAADSLGKRADYLRPLQGRFFAIRLDLGGRYSFTQFFTLGGIAVNERTGEALDRDGNPIPRLYAAGRAAVGICSNSYACSGLSIADAVFSGRRAGRHSAAG